MLNEMKRDFVTVHKNQKAFVRKNLHRGTPVIVLWKDNGNKTYAVLGKENGKPVLIWRSGSDGLGLTAVTQYNPNEEKIIKLKNGI